MGKLDKRNIIEITPTTPFDFDSTFHKPDHFTSGDNFWEKGIDGKLGIGKINV